jgi:hypothetical protein
MENILRRRGGIRKKIIYEKQAKRKIKDSR